MTENVVPLFQTFDEMRRSEAEIYKTHFDEWHAAYHRWDLVNAALQNDDTELAKLANTDAEQAFAKSEAARLKAASHVPRLDATIELQRTLIALCDKRDERLFGLGALAKRSARFASAHARTTYGPGASSLPPSN